MTEEGTGATTQAQVSRRPNNLQRPAEQLPIQRPPKVLIGIPAFNEESRIGKCLDSILAQSTAEFAALEILVVASGCTDNTRAVVESRMNSGLPLGLIDEKERTGKSHALSLLLSRLNNSDFDYLIVISADSVPAENALRHLIDFAVRTGSSLSCGSPSITRAERGSVRNGIAAFLWSLHNAYLAHSPYAAPHCCDELMCIKRGFVTQIPEYTINDGSYLRLAANRAGVKVGYCEDARVYVAVPSTGKELLEQRARVLLGHVYQIRKERAIPSVLEGRLLSNPLYVLRVISAANRKGLKLSHLFIAGIFEFVSYFYMFCKIFTDRTPWLWRKVSTE